MSIKNRNTKKSIDSSTISRMTSELEKILGKIDKDIKEGKNLSPILFSSKKVNNYLDNLYK